VRVPLLILFGLSLWQGWYVWAALLFFLGGPHPYPDFMEHRLGILRTALAVAAIIVFILCIMPSPLKGV